MIWLQFVSDKVDMNHLRLDAIVEFEVARSSILIHSRDQ